MRLQKTIPQLGDIFRILNALNPEFVELYRKTGIEISQISASIILIRAIITYFKIMKNSWCEVYHCKAAAPG